MSDVTPPSRRAAREAAAASGAVSPGPATSAEPPAAQPAPDAHTRQRSFMNFQFVPLMQLVS